jgi:uncharacterized protein (DUF488 family)
MTTPPPYPPKFHHLRHGQVFNWWINTGHLRVVHIDSADFIEQELQGRQADIVSMCDWTQISPELCQRCRALTET